MKKYITTILIIFVFAAIAQAQDGSRALTERLTGYYAERYDQGAWRVSDTAKYSYTGARGGGVSGTDYSCDMTTRLMYNNNSTALENYDRRTNTFDNNDRLTSYTDETWNVNAWVNTSKITMTYTTSGLTETFMQQKWQNLWVNEFLTTYTYDNNGNTLSSTSQKWVNNAWENMDRDVYTFDVNNNETSSQNDDWVNNAWKADRKTTRTYNNDGLLTEMLMQENMGAGLENTNRYTFLYNANQKAYESLSENWVLSSFWMNDTKGTYSYDVNGNQTGITQQLWDSDSVKWDNNTKYITGYDANSNKTSEVKQDWLGNTWVNNYQYTNTYNSGSKQLSALFERWINNAWQNDNRRVFEYDNNGYKSFEEYNEWENNAWIGYSKSIYTNTIFGNIATSQYATWQNGAYVDYSRRVNYFEPFDNGLSGIKENQFATVKMYPNPSGSIVNVEFFANDASSVTINVYNVSGVLVSSNAQTGNHGDNRFTFNAQQMPKGFYTVQIKSATAESNLKLSVN